MSFSQISFVFLSAAGYWFRYLYNDLIPILQPSVIRSATVEEVLSMESFMLVFSQDMPFAMVEGSFSSLWYSESREWISLPSFSWCSLLLVNNCFKSEFCTFSKTSSMDVTAILVPASHSFNKEIVSLFSI